MNSENIFTVFSQAESNILFLNWLDAIKLALRKLDDATLRQRAQENKNKVCCAPLYCDDTWCVAVHRGDDKHDNSKVSPEVLKAGNELISVFHESVLIRHWTIADSWVLNSLAYTFFKRNTLGFRMKNEGGKLRALVFKIQNNSKEFQIRLEFGSDVKMIAQCGRILDLEDLDVEFG